MQLGLLAGSWLLLASTGGAAAQDTEPNIELGERLVKARCAVCHSDTALSALVERCQAVHGKDFLDGFLANHHAPDEAARADIIAYLTCVLPESSQQ